MPSSRTSGRPTGLAHKAALAAAAVLAAASATLRANAEYTCNTNLGTYYPYCVNVPDGASSDDKLPTIVFLSGSGARGDASNVKSLSGYDGFGKLINQYNGGNHGADQTMAAEKFVTIIPISPKNVGGQEIRHWFPEYVDAVLDDVKGKYPIDWDRLHLSGYSMGARGCWRNAVAHPGLYASISPSAGAAEQPGDGTLSQQAASSVFDKLSDISKLAVWQFDGASDTTAGTAGPKATEAQLQKIGNENSKLTTLNTDHSGMSTLPFNTDLMNWMLEQTASGSGSSSGTSSTVTDNVKGGDDEDESDSNSDSDDEDSSISIGTSTSSSSAASSSSTGSSSSSHVALTSGKKCSSSFSSKRSRRNKAKRDAMYAEGLRYAHAGPVRRGIYASEDPHSSPMVAKRSVNKVRGLSLKAILASTRPNGSLKKDVAIAASNSTTAATNPSKMVESEEDEKLAKFVKGAETSSSSTSSIEQVKQETHSQILEGEQEDTQAQRRSIAVESLKAHARNVKRDGHYVNNMKLGRRLSRR